MEFNITTKKIDNLQKNIALIINIFEKGNLSNTADKLNKISNNYINNILHHDNMEGKIGQIKQLNYIPNVHYDNIICIGCGIQNEINIHQLQKFLYTLAKNINILNISEAVLFLNEIHVTDLNIYWKIRKTIEIFNNYYYRFNQYKNNQYEINNEIKLKKITFYTEKTEEKESLLAINHGTIIAESIKITKDLSNMPPNICNPLYLANHAKKLFNQSDKINIQIIDEPGMKSIGMNAYLAVGAGSKNSSIMTIIQYNGKEKLNLEPIIIIGKGLTFDSGGLSIKQSEKMDEMKFDMCGAAAIFGILNTIIKLNLQLHVIGVIAGCENMISSKSMRPGDIIKSLSGKTIEILNTDAEGRLILADVLTYVERFNPCYVIDIATLTGACVIALGHHMSGVMSNHNPLVKQLMLASKQTNDDIWELPLHQKFQKQLKSNFADIANIGGYDGGAITAGCFLSNFSKKYHWAHLDIAGTAWNSKKNKGATGRPVTLITQFLINYSKIN